MLDMYSLIFMKLVYRIILDSCFDDGSVLRNIPVEKCVENLIQGVNRIYLFGSFCVSSFSIL